MKNLFLLLPAVFLMAAGCNKIAVQPVPEPQPIAENSSQPSNTPQASYMAPYNKPQPTPEQDETATWEIYRSDKYGFEVKYPLNWKLSNEEDCGEGEDLCITFADGKSQDYIAAIVIRIASTYAQTKRQIIGRINPNIEVVTQEEKITINDIRSYAVEISSAENKGLTAGSAARKLLILGSTA
jgi:hypothetical protein